MSERLVIIGGVAGGMTAATWARRFSSTTEIIVLERGADVSYSECGMPYVFSGQVPSLDHLIRYQPQDLEKKYQIKVLTNSNVVGLNLSAQYVEIDSLIDKKGEKISFDYLVMATGARAKELNIEGAKLPGVFTLRHMAEARAIDSYLKTVNPRRAIILGAGYVGLEMAEALKMRGLEVTVIDESKQLLNCFDGELKGKILEELASQKVNVILGETIQAITGRSRVEQIITKSQTINTDLVIVAIGVSPTVSLAKASNIRLGASGAIAVKNNQQTNFPNVYAAGDCAEAHHLVLDKPCYIPLGTTANKQGRVAGINAVGGRASFAGVVGTQAIKIFDLEIATTGLSLNQALEANFLAKELSSHSVSRAGYYPGAKEIYTSLVYDERTGKLLGGQMVGRESVAKRIDVMATALYGKLRIEDVLQLDLSYAPPFAPVWEPLLYTARKTKDFK
ncbi:MAG: FAD-dependent oxidoreductase [Blastocatellia bacterium]